MLPIIGAAVAGGLGFLGSLQSNKQRNRAADRQIDDVLTALGLGITKTKQEVAAVETQAARKLREISEASIIDIGRLQVMAGASGLSGQYLERLEALSQVQTERSEEEVQDYVAQTRQAADLNIQQMEQQALSTTRQLREQKTGPGQALLEALSTGLGFAAQGAQLTQGIQDIMPTKRRTP